MSSHAMREIVADRFVMVRNGWIDLASGTPVRIRWRSPIEERDSAWNEWCAEFSRLRHPLINPLVDYGRVGRTRTFEAFAANELPASSRLAASRFRTHLGRFFEWRGI